MDQESLFSSNNAQTPLAEQKRPVSFDDLVGQSHILNQRLRKIIQTDRWTGFVFWGPPGTGKTSLAKIIAQLTLRPFRTLSGVTCGIKDIKEVLDASKRDFLQGRPSHVLFLDEIHRLNKSQQDVLLPFLEEGSIRFIGATTENPSFEVNNAIISRSLVFQFVSLSQEEIVTILKKALPTSLRLEAGVLEAIAQLSGGDARRALNLLDHLSVSVDKSHSISLADLDSICKAQHIYYDKHGEAHHHTISAFIKSVRGSDPDAAVYYLARMLEAGEDPLFIARRLIILASEDIGNANPAGLMVATSAFNAIHAIGMPEGRIVLAHATTYLACSEKSNKSYVAINQAQEEVKRSGNLEIPPHLKNHSRNYQYPHDSPAGWVACDYLPEKLLGKVFYEPTGHGQEKRISEFLQQKRKPRGKA